MVGCGLSQLKPSEFYILSCEKGLVCLISRSVLLEMKYVFNKQDLQISGFKFNK